MRLKRIIHLVYNPGHEGLNCTIRSCAHHIFFNSSMLKKKTKKLIVTSYPSHTKQPKRFRLTF